jgi:hypothetical protein
MIRSLLKRFDGFATALDIVSKNLNLELYPNPATNSINLRADIGIAIELFSIDGKKLMNFITEEENSLINISNLSNGIYFLKATDNNKSQKTLKFVKSH